MDVRVEERSARGQHSPVNEMNGRNLPVVAFKTQWTKANAVRAMAVVFFWLHCFFGLVVLYLFAYA